ncbi:VOC family protein [Hyphococcus lacteus]|uniref:VOC family protein n=1 Tax=Hyphococcus lacteus TaxID=3143536 RepID=A0ABV3Z335_9PROT
MHIPDGFSQITPYIFADDALAYMDHLVQALDGLELGRTLNDDGKLANGQVRIGSASIMVSEAGQGFPPSSLALYLYVENANTAFEKAITGDMTKIMDVADMPYGDRQGGVKDIAGNIWWISQRLSSAPYY